MADAPLPWDLTFNIITHKRIRKSWQQNKTKATTRSFWTYEGKHFFAESADEEQIGSRWSTGCTQYPITLLGDEVRLAVANQITQIAWSQQDRVYTACYSQNDVTCDF